jgi:putative membrane protein
MRFAPYHPFAFGWGAWVLGILVTIAFWGLLITAVVWLIRSIRRPGPRMPYAGQVGPGWPGGHQVPSAEQILAERYARGDIGEEEYRARLTTLRGGPGAPAGPPGPPPPTG